MIYFEQLPTEQLSKYIDKFWYCQSDDLTNTTLSIPLLHHELVFNFSDKYFISDIAGLNKALENPKSWISGIQTKPVLSKSVGRHEMVGVLFKPNGLKAFIKYHSCELENRFTDATLIFDKSLEILTEQIQNTIIVTAKISLIENYLLKNLNTDSPPNYLNESLNLFKLQTDKRISVKNTCNQVLVSNKSLIKSYQKYIGITPIKFLQIQSVNKAIYNLSKKPKQSLTNLAYQLNFSDQAHFINLFKSTTSITPKQYSDYVLKNNIDCNSPNFISL